jgi:hypothetical protein
MKNQLAEQARIALLDAAERQELEQKAQARKLALQKFNQA